MDDVIDHLAGLAPGAPVAAIRAERPVARDNAQASFAALFRPAAPEAVSLVERRAVALFVARLHGDAAASGFYAALLAEAGPPTGLAEAIEAEGRAGAAEGPAGRYREAALAAESTPAPAYAVAAESRDGLGPRLAAALSHAHMLVFRPREADAAALGRLVEAGWTTTGIVTLSQIVSFLAFQIRVAAGLRTLAATPAT